MACVNQVKTDNTKCLSFEYSRITAENEGRYADVLSLLTQFKQCVQKMDTYINQNKNCPEDWKAIPKGLFDMYNKRLIQSYALVNLACKRDYGQYAV